MKKNLNFQVEVDENHLPVNIKMNASDGDVNETNINALMISAWDAQNKETDHKGIGEHTVVKPPAGFGLKRNRSGRQKRDLLFLNQSIYKKCERGRNEQYNRYDSAHFKILLSYYLLVNVNCKNIKLSAYYFRNSKVCNN